MALPVLMAMGDGRPGPVVLPGGDAAPGTILNREGSRPAQPDATPQAPTVEPLRVLEAGSVSADQFRWQQRVVVVFADTAADLSFTRQLQELQAQAGALEVRDVVVVTDTDPAAMTRWRRDLRPEGFSLILMDKDGQVMARKPLPWTVREIARTIDKSPTRLEETGRAGLGL